MAKKRQNNIPNRRLVTKQKRPQYMKKNHAVILFVVSALVLVGAVIGLILTK